VPDVPKQKHLGQALAGRRHGPRLALAMIRPAASANGIVWQRGLVSHSPGGGGNRSSGRRRLIMRSASCTGKST